MNLRLKGKVEIAYIFIIVLMTLLTGCQINDKNEELTDTSIENQSVIYETESADITILEITTEVSTEFYESTESSIEQIIAYDIPQSETKTPQESIIDYMENEGALQYYFYDFTKDGYPEVLIDSYGGMQSNTLHIINDVVNAANQNRGCITYTTIDDTTQYTIEHYFDHTNNMDLYYNTVVENYNSEYYQVSEAYCWYKDGVYVDDEWVIHEKEIPKEDEASLKDYITEIRKGLEKYQLIDVIKLDTISDYELLVDGYEDIITNYGKKEPLIEINVNGTIQKYPWNTYRFEITEEFDWSELNKLPNLKFVKVNVNSEDVDYEKLALLKNISALEISTKLNSYDWISNMNWLQGVTLSKCSDLNFITSLKGLKFINVAVASENVDFTSPLLENKKLEWVSLEGASDEQREWWRENSKVTY